LILALVVGFCGFGLLAWQVLEWTSSNAFCASCHEMDQAVLTWIRSTHYTNPSGDHVDCVDCHLPPRGRIVPFLLTKGETGFRDVAKHVLGADYDGQALRERMLETLPDSQCTGCHEELFSPEMDKSAHIAHTVVLFPQPGKERSCVSCHPWVGHDREEGQPRRIKRPPEVADEESDAADGAEAPAH